MKSDKFTVSSFLKAKQSGEKISMLTAYDYSTARLIDEAGVDSILVGDSLGMVVLGYENTLQVTVDDIIHHCRAVSRGAKMALVIGDMPFLSYHISPQESVKNAGRIIQEGMAHAVKLEGGRDIIDSVKAIVRAQIPVVGHLGLTPQSVNMLGGFKVQGREEDKAKKMIEDALMLQEAGVFCIVLECVPMQLAQLISERLDIPTIGIGAGSGCGGQVLVTQDMLGMYTDFTPKFVKQYANMKDDIISAVRGYIDELKSGRFPGKDHSFTMDEEKLKRLY
ncbi:ketopantoate hydroxymethyltransferase [Peptoclostridium litorale DSM 5388]|uniref:3-methyl-2-oxobutanoate hydroxymethyltransferase n=1 Tax=Peptoclostridium litorale DSM 5388 TaxID=1121324 RepID=A0A069RHA3_PEPLI|nr:3-methyl-2-oxobutanoate hydroxymethyltransferase [Peptoclostridium litorale]KDR96148.1 3-methyl-2-oxobutanoate hydroxymethyltransferase PanB [Peptoclostridium litorale DSM 5388]SIO03576.1 ketopantoate hydroxymethyltransferase [Peptoclostridium litorale DSM 5388]